MNFNPEINKTEEKLESFVEIKKTIKKGTFKNSYQITLVLKDPTKDVKPTSLTFKSNFKEGKEIEAEKRIWDSIDNFINKNDILKNHEFDSKKFCKASKAIHESSHPISNFFDQINPLSSNKKTIDFEAVYNFGNESEQIKPKNIFLESINSAVTRPLKSIIFPGAALIIKDIIIDSKRVEKATQQLLNLGGQQLNLKTPDGEVIDSMYMDTKGFKEYLEKYCDLIENENDDGTISQMMTLKPEYCERVIKTDPDKFTLMAPLPSPEVKEFLKTVEGLFSIVQDNLLHQEKQIRGLTIDLGRIPKTLLKKDADGSSPTVLIAGGAGMSYALFKEMAVTYLMRGINVMMVDYRGYGKSEGSPTDNKLKLDLETAYQYLIKEKHVENKQLLLHGYCLGGAPTTDLAARRPGVNIVLDRTFANFTDLVKERLPVIKSIVHRIMPIIINFNNAENVKKIEGKINFVFAEEDQVIPKSQNEKLVDNVPETSESHVMNVKGGHTEAWTKLYKAKKEFDLFLQGAELSRRLFG